MSFESSQRACERLNVSTQTLYAYVSRGLVRTAAHAQDSRKRLYASADIDQLIARQTRGRSRQSIAESTIDFGEPILNSKISHITDGQFYYRNVNAVELSRTASLEQVFELLCETTLKNTCKAPPLSNHRTAFGRLIDALSKQVSANPPYGNKRHAYYLLTLMAQNAANSASDQPIHQQLARAWTSDDRAPELIRQALVLCADHELNASSYATRVTASAGASLSACLLTGLSTLSGNRHGGLTEQCLAWMRSSSPGKPSTELLNNFSKDQPPPGFGHKLYPNGDPRALEMLLQCPPTQAWSERADAVIEKTQARPVLDFGLANLVHQLALPKDAGFSIFAVGRTVGWLAHCFEQRRSGQLIRPRAWSSSRTA